MAFRLLNDTVFKSLITPKGIVFFTLCAIATPVYVFGDVTNEFRDGEIIYADGLNANFSNLDARVVLFEETLSISDEGEVGIGTKTPQCTLEIGESAQGGYRSWMQKGVSIAWDTDNAYFGLKDEGSDRQDTVIAWGDGYASTHRDSLRFIYVDSGGPDDSFDEFMRIDSNGNVGIGTTIPEYALDVVGQVRADNIQILSDARLKTDVSPLDNALEGVQCLEGVTFRWSDPAKPQDLQLGLIAQEVEDCFPEVVFTDASGYKSVDYDHLVVPLVEAVKEQQRVMTDQQKTIEVLAQRDAEQQRELAAMNARLARLESLLDVGQ